MTGACPADLIDAKNHSYRASGLFPNPSTNSIPRNFSSDMGKPVIKKRKYSRAGCLECKKRKIKVCLLNLFKHFY